MVASNQDNYEWKPSDVADISERILLGRLALHLYQKAQSYGAHYGSVTNSAHCSMLPSLGFGNAVWRLTTTKVLCSLPTSEGSSRTLC